MYFNKKSILAVFMAGLLATGSTVQATVPAAAASLSTADVMLPIFTGAISGSYYAGCLAQSDWFELGLAMIAGGFIKGFVYDNPNNDPRITEMRNMDRVATWSATIASMMAISAAKIAIAQIKNK